MSCTKVPQVSESRSYQQAQPRSFVWPVGDVCEQAFSHVYVAYEPRRYRKHTYENKPQERLAQRCSRSLAARLRWMCMAGSSSLGEHFASAVAQEVSVDREMVQ